MTLHELYAQTPAERHLEILVSGTLVFFEGREYLLLPDGELRLLRSLGDLERRVEEIAAKLGL